MTTAPRPQGLPCESSTTKYASDEYDEGTTPFSDEQRLVNRRKSLSVLSLALLSDSTWLVTLQALMGIKASLKDPHGVLDNWDEDAVDPCSWTMFICSAESLVMNCKFNQEKTSFLYRQS
nr:protein NSP-INTERACTING KINASE 1-like [Ipomoea batatas]